MPDSETKDAIQSTALAVVESQQKVVGGALVGGGASVLSTSTDSSVQILEQLRDLQIKAVRGIKEVATKLGDMLTFDKDASRREREQANELAKENQGGELEPGSAGIEVPEDDVKEGKGKLQAIGSFFAGLPGVGFIAKIFKPILAFFSKSGFLVKVFGRFGPLGAFILGATLLYKYSDEIAKALAPALDKIKALFVKLKPAIDVLMSIGDFLIKGIIKGIGEAISFVIGIVEGFIDGFIKLFTGDFTGGLSQIFESILKVIFAVPLMIVNFLKPLFMDLVNMIAEPWNNMVNSVHEYIGNLFTSISDFFFGMIDSVVGFFVTGYENAKEQITSDINGMIETVSGIFTAIKDAFTNAYDSVLSFVMGIPDQIMGFVSNMFEPITSFFSGIKNSIVNVINGILDSLPLPDFLKDKVKMKKDTTAPDITTTAKESMPKKKKSLNEYLKENEKQIKDYAEARGLPIDLKMTYLAHQQAPDKKPTIYFGSPAYSDMMSLDNLVENTKLIKSGERNTAQQDLKEQRGTPKLEASKIKPLANNQAPVTNIVNQTNAPVQTNVASNSTHAGKLDTGVDPYHDRHAFAGT